MQLVSFTSTLWLTIGALAAPSDSTFTKKADIVSGDHQKGSIFMFGDAQSCRQTFWTGGACGLSTYFADKVDGSLPLIAMPSGIFDKYGQAQNNKLCGKIITMTHEGVTKRAVVADENTSSEQTIDMCLDIWQAFGGKDNDGSLREGITWSISA
ncbi:mrsp1/expansinlike protein [Fusarium sporotrichioides]|uniref:Mrsp1/expansinlike protein n=1 Tax=Fusarium sporotrichioides TaxID=5514 RepID=A0A395RFJ3_FUSSP|nr:mrsp1/expansinlike protein [Fusarium sporotrichioides]